MTTPSTDQQSTQPFTTTTQTPNTGVDTATTLATPPTRSPVIEVLTTPELIHAIFDHLSVPQLVNVRSVCKQWYQIVNIPSRTAAYVNYTVRSRHKKVYILTNSTYSCGENDCISDISVAIDGVYTDKRKAQSELNKRCEEYEGQMYNDYEESNVRIIGGFDRRGYYDYDMDQGEVWELDSYDLDDGEASEDEAEEREQPKAAELESVEEGGVTYYIID
ncbi:11831_t:CDS:1 [Acaulospora colombiana]|uniref:11831_t:CDS:1 n=1 Tax=Acaulospora colombiana TaxID=27376 RepID=A0ACA9K6S1_9GLOM|nr:11831_t:CDS:1 [Acaulospora colombiana]